MVHGTMRLAAPMPYFVAAACEMSEIDIYIVNFAIFFSSQYTCIYRSEEKEGKINKISPNLCKYWHTDHAIFITSYIFNRM